MRRVVGLFFAVIFMLLVPTLVPAEGLLGLGIPWGSSWGQASGCDGGCCGTGAYYGAWGKCCPAVYVGYEIQQGRIRRPVNVSLDLTTAGNIPIVGDGTGAASLSQQLSTDFSDPGGLWLGVSNYCQLSDRVGILASGWYLFPSSGDAQENYSTGLQLLLPTEDPTYGNARTWSTTRSWGWIDGALVFGSPCGLNLIAGFRWDSYSIKLNNPSPVNPLALLPTGTSSDEADLTLNSYIPLIGTQCCWGGPCCGLLVRVVGFPWVPGNLRYGETVNEGLGTRLEANVNYNRGYFLEIFSEYSKTCPGFGCVGIFARWNELYCRSDVNPDTQGPTSLRIALVTPIRTSWTIGGRVALNFDVPF